MANKNRFFLVFCFFEGWPPPPKKKEEKISNSRTGSPRPGEKWPAVCNSPTLKALMQCFSENRKVQPGPQSAAHARIRRKRPAGFLGVVRFACQKTWESAQLELGVDRDWVELQGVCLYTREPPAQADCSL